MLPSLERMLSLKLLIWAFPVVFLIHDGEEILTVERFLQAHSNLIARFGIPAGITSTQFASAAALIFVLVAVVTLRAASNPRSPAYTRLFTFGVVILLVNSITHLGQTCIIGAYTPGVVTAGLITLPYSLYTLRRLFLAKLIDRRTLMKMAGAGLVVFVILVAAAQGLVRVLFN